MQSGRGGRASGSPAPFGHHRAVPLRPDRYLQRGLTSGSDSSDLPSAEGGGRTRTPRREPDFESGASASSATSAGAWILAPVRVYPGPMRRGIMLAALALACTASG